VINNKDKIAIVMATYNPNPIHLIEQITSMKLQSIRNWSCYISDDASTSEWFEEIESALDERFKVMKYETNLGPYRNFERALSLIKDEEFIFLCDQDDIWDYNKLEKSMELFSEGVSLVHSNARLIDANGDRLPNNLHNIERTSTDNYTVAGILLKNSITGCTSAIRRDVLYSALPFPDVGGIQHDLWLGLVALQNGQVAYSPLELISYRQHSKNFVGVHKPSVWQEFFNPRRAAVSYLIKSQLKRAFESRFRVGLFVKGTRLVTLRKLSVRQLMYAFNYRYGKIIVRLHDLPTHIKIKTVTSLYQIKKFTKSPRDKNQKRMVAISKAKRSLRFIKEISKSPALRGKIYSSIKLMESEKHSITKRVGDKNRWTLPQLAPLRFQVIDRNTTCIVVFVPSLSRDTIFGGLATAIRVATEIGLTLDVQICVTDEFEHRLDESDILEMISSLNLNSKSFRKMLLNVEYGTVSFSEKDIFISTAWWTTAKAKQLIQTTNLRTVKIYYLVQDFEPLFYAASDLYAAALSTYHEADYLVVNSVNLAKYISHSLKLDLNPKFVFEPEYLKQDLPVRQIRSTRIGALKIVVYGRPSVQRNLFLTMVNSIEGALLQLPDLSCEILSVGEIHDDLTLESGHVVKSLGKLSISEYKKLLSTADLGVSLMLSPHPSYPPLEMASAGMQVVTNDFLGYKKSLESLFQNIHVAEPNTEDISKTILSILSKSPRAQIPEGEMQSEGVSIEILAANLLNSFVGKDD
jgi:hypothetical protein